MKSILSISFFLVFMVTVYNMMESLDAKVTHPGNMDCNSCHLAKDNITEANAKTLVASQEELCKSCHKNALTASHPSGFKPTKKPPEMFPLDWKGDLTCSTCHNVHGSERGFLRVNLYGKSLCLSCHKEEFFSKMKDGGTSLISSGHLDARKSLAGNIDLFSVQCMSCHGSLADVLNVQLSNNVIRHSSGRVNHPIGMQYQNSMTFGSYHPPGQLSEKIILPDGKVSCISCHESYSERHGKLVIDNKNSRLCFSCHDM